MSWVIFTCTRFFFYYLNGYTFLALPFAINVSPSVLKYLDTRAGDKVARILRYRKLVT